MDISEGETATGSFTMKRFMTVIVTAPLERVGYAGWQILFWAQHGCQAPALSPQKVWLYLLQLQQCTRGLLRKQVFADHCRHAQIQMVRHCGKVNSSSLFCLLGTSSTPGQNILCVWCFFFSSMCMVNACIHKCIYTIKYYCNSSNDSIRTFCFTYF